MNGTEVDALYVVKTVIDTVRVLDAAIGELLKNVSQSPRPVWNWLPYLLSFVAFIIGLISGWLLSMYNAKQTYLLELAKRRFDYAEKIMSSFYRCLEKAVMIADKNDRTIEKLSTINNMEHKTLVSIKNDFRAEITEYYKAVEAIWPNIWLMNAFDSEVDSQSKRFKEKLNVILEKLRRNLEPLEGATRKKSSKADLQKIGDIGQDLSDDFMKLSDAMWRALRHRPKDKVLHSLILPKPFPSDGA